MLVNKNTEFCGIEFGSEADLEGFLRLYPKLRRRSNILKTREYLIMLLWASECPIRDASGRTIRGINEIFNQDGSLHVTLLGADALEEIYTIYEFDYYMPKLDF